MSTTTATTKEQTLTAKEQARYEELSSISMPQRTAAESDELATLDAKRQKKHPTGSHGVKSDVPVSNLTPEEQKRFDELTADQKELEYLTAKKNGQIKLTDAETKQLLALQAIPVPERTPAEVEEWKKLTAKRDS